MRIASLSARASALGAALVLAAGCAGSAATGESLAQSLDGIAVRRRVPALAAALVRDGEVVARATVGRLLAGSEERAGENSRFHIGSTTKSMTALVLAGLVAEGRLSWETTLEQALPGVPMLEAYRGATLHDLLLSRAGIVAMQNSNREDPAVVERLWVAIPRETAEPRAQRRAVTQYALSLPPIAAPGSTSIYSNVGWAIAGHIAEVAADRPYEELLCERIFARLGMTSSRVGGWPAGPQEPDQPRGHYPPAGIRGQPRPQELDDPFTFPSWMNPSGGVSCTIDDFALYAREMLRGARGQGTLVDAAGYARILSVQGIARAQTMYPGGGERGELRLGYGWAEYPTRDGTAFAADGTGGTFYARIALAPKHGLAFVALANAGHAEPAITEVQRLLTGIR